MRKDKQVELVFYFVGAVFIAWLSVLVAPCIHKGLFDAIIYLNEAMNSPFSFELCQDTLKCILISESIYSFSYLTYYYNRKNYRRNEEYGSAKWANNKAVNKKYTEKDYSSNKILSQNVRIGLDGRRHRRNLNTLVIGGSGAGKTRFFGKPNLMQCNTSFVVLDPKGEQLRDVGNLLEKEGYVIKVVDLINMNRSHCYNPFRYIKDDKDVLKLITNLIRNTTPKGSQTNDPFWEKSETALLEALCLYLLHEAPEEEQNFTMVMEMIAAAEVKEDDEEYQSPLDELFERLEIRNPNSLALKQYKIYKQAAGKTAKSILISVGVRLSAFNLESIASLTATDELELDLVGERKTAIFAVIPDNDPGDGTAGARRILGDFRGLPAPAARPGLGTKNRISLKKMSRWRFLQRLIFYYALISALRASSQAVISARPSSLRGKSASASISLSSFVSGPRHCCTWICSSWGAA